MKKSINNLIPVLTMRNVKASGTNTELKLIMDFAKLALKMNNIKIKAQKKEITFTIILNVINVKRNSFFKTKNIAKQAIARNVLIC